SAVSKKLHQRLKHSFDANGVFNPGRLYSWL
ncbi:MAG: glycolate oxidase FAD binding subunit, partial [Halioglobus sp.]